MQLATQTYSGWGRVRSQTAMIARPERLRALREAVAQSERILPIGALRSYGDAALVSGGTGLRMERLDRLLAFDGKTGILEAEAGIALGDILEVMGPSGWMPAILPGTGRTTLGGAIANDVHGKNHHVAGTFAQHVESLQLISPSGVAQIVEPGSDLFAATAGGVGLTGVIVSARIRLARCPGDNMDVTETRIPDLDAFFDAFEAATSPYQVGWIDALARGAALGRGIFEMAEFAAPGHAKRPGAKTRTIPALTPGLLAAPAVRAFNEVYFRRIPAQGRRRIRSLRSFFFPLDAIRNWNRLYGRKGFYQFQCVVPQEAARGGLRSILTATGEAGIASPLAVIKKMGPGRAGYLSFPLEGMTLAIDLPNTRGTPSLLQKLHRIALDHGGRVYLAKDCAADAGTFAAMYPDLDQFQRVVRDIDPTGKFRSFMSERLNLKGPR